MPILPCTVMAAAIRKEIKGLYTTYRVIETHCSPHPLTSLSTWINMYTSVRTCGNYLVLSLPPKLVSEDRRRETRQRERGHVLFSNFASSNVLFYMRSLTTGGKKEEKKKDFSVTS